MREALLSLVVVLGTGACASPSAAPTRTATPIASPSPTTSASVTKPAPADEPHPQVAVLGNPCGGGELGGNPCGGGELGGLGLTGAGGGGAGRGDTIGIGGIGTIGHGSGQPGQPGPAPGVKLKVGPPVARGPLTAVVIGRFVRRRVPELAACLAAATPRTARVAIDLTIGTGGAVTAAASDGPACVAEILRTIVFPTASSETTARIPLDVQAP